MSTAAASNSGATSVAAAARSPGPVPDGPVSSRRTASNASSTGPTLPDPHARYHVSGPGSRGKGTGRRRNHRRGSTVSKDAIVLLKEDHKEIRKLFKEFQNAGRNAKATKGGIVDRILELLTVHTYLENECM